MNANVDKTKLKKFEVNKGCIYLNKIFFFFKHCKCCAKYSQLHNDATLLPIWKENIYDEKVENNTDTVYIK